MRTLVAFLICAATCPAQPPDDQVRAAFIQIEKAEQTGDANAWVGLWSRESASEAEKMRPYLRPRPTAHYTASKIFAQGDDAALLGQIAANQFLSERLVKQDGLWKIRDQVWSDKPFPADSVYALVPPPPGAFGRAGSPWQSLAPAFTPADAARKGWQVRATYDESFLCIQIELPTPIPAPGTTAERPPSGWPVIKADVSGFGEFVIFANANIGVQAAFDESGHANSHRHYVSYDLRLERARQMIFQASTDLHPNPLVQVAAHSFEVRVPLRTMGVTNAPPAKITLGDAQWPKPALFSLDLKQYR